MCKWTQVWKRTLLSSPSYGIERSGARDASAVHEPVSFSLAAGSQAEFTPRQRCHITVLSWQFRIVFYQDLPVLGLPSSGRSHYCLFLSHLALRFLKTQRWAGTVLRPRNGLLTDAAERWEGPASISHRSDPAYGTVDASKLEEK